MDIEKAIVVLSNMISDGIIMTEDETEAIEIAVFFLPKLLKYRQIGTVEECKAARERQNQKNIILNSEADREYEDYICPSCKDILQQRKKGATAISIYHFKHCPNCGQALKWED